LWLNFAHLDTITAHNNKDEKKIFFSNNKIEITYICDNKKCFYYSNKCFVNINNNNFVKI